MVFHFVVTTILGRLPTKDKLRSWGIAADSNCVLCHGGLEGHNHLFFDCSFANLVWKAVKSWYDWGHVSRTLEVKLQWGMLHCSRRSMKPTVYKLGLAAAVYHLWRERNFQIFQQKGMDHDADCKRILE